MNLKQKNTFANIHAVRCLYSGYWLHSCDVSNFSHQLYLTLWLKGFPLELGTNTRGQKPGGQKSFKTGSAI